MVDQPRYDRVLIKLSGEALMGDGDFGYDTDVMDRYVAEIKQVAETGTSLALVVGGGNLYRGMHGSGAGMDRARADHIGMLATIMNGLALEDAFSRGGVEARALSAIAMPSLCEPYSVRAARGHLDAGRVVICAGGTGNPFFTTDTAAALRAAELQTQALLKATQVDGIYSADPRKDPAAIRYDRLTYSEVLSAQLQVMDLTAIALAQENDIPIIVFSIHQPGSLAQVLRQAGSFTFVHH